MRYFNFIQQSIGHANYDGGYGRIETRTVYASSNIDWLKKLHPEWTGLK